MVVVVLVVVGAGVVKAPEVLIPRFDKLVQLNGADTSPWTLRLKLKLMFTFTFVVT